MELKLPNKSDYIKTLNNNQQYNYNQYSEPKYICPKCNNGGMRKKYNDCICLTSLPPIFKQGYECDKCGYSEYLEER